MKGALMKKQQKDKGCVKKISAEITPLPSGAHALAAIGPEVEKIVHKYFRDEEQTLLAKAKVKADQTFLKQLAEAFSKGWSHEEAAKVVTAYVETFTDRSIDESALCRWVLSHPNDARAVCDCMNVEPPPEINIIRVLSRAGSQKLVFLATWKLTQRQVVLKQLRGPSEITSTVLMRELQPHPLSMGHPNIIETHLLKNAKGEPFLVEECLPLLLNDKWRSGGIQEAANLLYDIADALNYLHVTLDLVHGDIKPDNIGKKGENYILLDFGICRHSKAFSYEATATGSLRTRAPELLKNDSYPYPHKVDIWALGATVFNASVGRFPLFDFDESPPRISSPDDRNKYEEMLSYRVEHEWDKRVDLSLVPDPIRKLLSVALEKDPSRRCSAMDLIKDAEKQLSAFLRKYSHNGRFSPLDELHQLTNYLPDKEILKLMPEAQKQALKGRITKLKDVHGFDKEQKHQADELLSLIG